MHSPSRTRGGAYVVALREAGFAVRWLPKRGAPARGGLDRLRFAAEKRARTMRQWAALARARGVVYVQRQVLPQAVLGHLHRRGVPLVYDFDDALFLVDEASVGRMVRAAAAVIVASPELAGFCEAHGKMPVIIPTPVETDRIVPAAHPPTMSTVGWIGSPWTTPYLALVADVLVALARRLPLRVRLVGAADPPPMPGVDVEVLPWTFEGEAAALAGMSVGIMPLPDEAWAAGKGAYKLYQYMAAGLPVVASPVGINRQVVEDGRNGFLAATPGDWAAALERLTHDPTLARQLGAEGRRHAETRYSRTVCAGRLVEILRSVLVRGPA